MFKDDEVSDARRDLAAEKNKSEREDVMKFGKAPIRAESGMRYSCDEPPMKKSIQPLGFYVLVEMEVVEDISPGGIYKGDVTKEQGACDIGYIRAIGPIAFRGFPGCNPSEYSPSHSFYSSEPHEIWGISVGDKVEYRSFEGKLSGVNRVKNMRYIPDTQIIGKVN